MVGSPRDPASVPLAHPLASATVGAGLLVVVSGPLLVQGGIAPVVVGAGVAALVGVPLATLEVGERVGDPRVHAVRGLLLSLAAAAALAHAAQAQLATLPLDLPVGLGGPVVVAAFTGAHAAVGGGLFLLALQRVHQRRAVRFAALAPFLLVAAALVRGLGLPGLVSSQPRVPWTLLTPTWAPAGPWLPGAVLWGLLAGGAGLGLWSRSEGTPTARVRPWLTAGVGLALLLALAWVTGGAYERLVHATAGRAPVVLPHLLGLGVALAHAAVWGVLLLASPSARLRTLREVVLWSVVLAVLGTSAPTWVWLGGLPLALAAGLALDVRHRVGAPRVITAGAALLAAGAGLAGFPAVPDHVGPAVGGALALVALVWAAGVRSLRPVPA